MCSQNQLTNILSSISQTAKSTFGEKLNAVILYGSYARGDYNSESDIDIMVLADVDRVDLFRYKKPFIELTSRLGMENDIVITVSLKDKKTFEEYAEAVPFYQAVLKEGVPIAV